MTKERFYVYFNGAAHVHVIDRWACHRIVKTFLVHPTYRPLARRLAEAKREARYLNLDHARVAR